MQISLIPRQQVPDLVVPIVGGSTWSLAEQTPQKFTLIVVYRGLHCPICSHYLADLNQQIEAFNKLGVDVLVLSSDDEARASQTKQDWQLGNLPVGYNLPIETARKWGLYISSSNGKTSAGVVEPDPSRVRTPPLDNQIWSPPTASPLTRAPIFAAGV